MTKKIIRTAILKLQPTGEQKDKLDQVVGRTINRAADILREFLNLRGREVYVRNRGTEEREVHKFSFSEDPKIAEMGKSLYELIVKAAKGRSIRGPLVLPSFRGGKGKSELDQQLSLMFNAGVLPISSLVKMEGIQQGYDFAAFSLAHAAIKSWNTWDEKSYSNYEEQEKTVESFDISEKTKQQLESWMERYSIFLTRKVVAKFRRFGWDVWLRNYHFEELKKINGSAEFWSDVFSWKVSQNKLERMIPGANFTFPDVNNSGRSVPFGSNSVSFDLEMNGNQLVFSYENQKVSCRPTQYFRDLKVTPSNEGNYYDINYIRGNNSPLNEQVCGLLKEANIFTRKGEYYLALPMEIHAPDPSPKSENFCSYWNINHDEWTKDIRVMGVDLGINTPAACHVIKTLEQFGDYESLESFSIGEKKPTELCKGLSYLENRIKHVYRAIAILREIRKETTGYKGAWGYEFMRVVKMVDSVKKKMKQLKRFNIYKERQHGPSHDQVAFIRVYKKYIGLLQKWTYFDTKPAERGETRTGFEKHYKYLNNLKLDFRKKVACEIVRQARVRNVETLVVEDLQHFLPDQENKTSQNELLMIWGSGQIGKWINHFAEQYGIQVIFIDAKHTSQIDAKTGFFGSRSKFNKQEIKVEREGKVITIDADLNAAENIAARAVHRGTNDPTIKAYRVGEESHILGEKGPDKRNPRRKAQIQNTFIGKILIIQGIAQYISEEDLEKLKLGKQETLYRYPDGWWSEKIHRERQKEKLCDWWGSEKPKSATKHPKIIPNKDLPKIIRIPTARKSKVLIQ